MKELLQKWGAEFETAELSPLKSGIWQVRTAKHSYILKRRGNRTRVWEEYDLLNWLAGQEQPVSKLLYAQNEVPWAEFDGSIYVLYPYLAGQSGQVLNWDQDYARKTGAGLARLHRALHSYPAAEAFPRFDLFQEVASFAWPTLKSYLARDFRDRLQDLEQGISRQLINPYEVLPRPLIHRDFHPGNLVFRGGDLAGILDFDRVRRGIRLFDLCYLSTAVLSAGFTQAGGREGWLNLVRAFLEGYHSLEPLSKTEGHCFLYIVYLIQILFIAFYLDAGNQELADRNIAMLLWINDQHDFFEPVIEKSVAGP